MNILQKYTNIPSCDKAYMHTKLALTEAMSIMQLYY